MASAKEIKNRIRSIKDTQKITNAMYLIASTKLRKAKKELDDTKPYFVALREEIKRIFRTAGDVKSKYFYQDDRASTKDAVYACLIITADKGLAGAYNMNVIKAAQKLISSHSNTKLFVVGEYGRQYFLRHNIPIEHSFLYTAQNPTMQRAREISSLLLDCFEKNQVEKIFVVYTDYKSSIMGEAKSTRLLPFHRSYFTSEQEKHEKPVTTPFEFYPSIEKVLDGVMESYVSGFIYSALVDSFCCEQNARMNAMSAANENAQDLLSKLAISFNRARQAAITREITEISAGSKHKNQRLF